MTPVKFYTGADLGGGIQVINTLDPVNPTDVATKHYADTHVPTPLSKQILWERSYVMVCAVNNYTGAFSVLNSGPNPQTITKLYANTGIRFRLGTSCWITPAVGQITYGVAVNGGPVTTIIQPFFNTTYHSALGLVEWTFLPGAYSQVNATGSMLVQPFVATAAGITWHTDGNDRAAWTISEVLP